MSVLHHVPSVAGGVGHSTQVSPARFMFDCRFTVRAVVVSRSPRSRTACTATYGVGATDNEAVVVTATAAPTEVSASAGANGGVSALSTRTTEARIEPPRDVWRPHSFGRMKSH